MMRSMYSGVSGLRTHQIRMDIIGNNIANVNTVGFKKSRAVFQDVFYQILRGGSAPVSGTTGGTNPQAIGLGVGLASVDTITTPGSPQNTGKGTDLSINGNGYFILRNGQEDFYTRAGTFDFDQDGKLVYPNGFQVMGYTVDPSTGVIGTTISPIDISGLRSVRARATTTMNFTGNLDSNGAMCANGTLTFNAVPVNGDTVTIGNDTYTFVNGAPGTDFEIDISGFTNPSDAAAALAQTINDHTTEPVTAVADGATVVVTACEPGASANSIVTSTSGPYASWAGSTLAGGEGEYVLTSKEIYDSLGNPHIIYFRFARTAVDTNQSTWRCEISTDDSTFNSPVTEYLTFDGNGQLTGSGTTNLTLTLVGATTPQEIEIDFSALTQYNATSTAWIESQDGYASGELKSFTIDQSGKILGSYSNGISRQLGQVALATFDNPAGLTPLGGNLFQVSSNSGDANTQGKPGEGSKGTIIAGSLEMSNVDLSEEFTDMIVTQRGFQANSRIITTSDEMLQELVNLKR